MKVNIEDTVSLTSREEVPIAKKGDNPDQLETYLNDVMVNTVVIAEPVFLSVSLEEIWNVWG